MNRGLLDEEWRRRLDAVEMDGIIAAVLPGSLSFRSQGIGRAGERGHQDRGKLRFQGADDALRAIGHLSETAQRAVHHHALTLQAKLPQAALDLLRAQRSHYLTHEPRRAGVASD